MAETENALAVTETVEQSTSESLSSIVGRLVHAIDKVLGSGEVAELRRLRPENPACPVFWKVMAEYWDLSFDDGDAQRRACLLSGIARTKGLHDFQIRLGTALAAAGYSELRFVRLLRAEGKTLFKEIELVAEFLNSKAESANWTEIAEILFTKDEDRAESLRRRIARNYYKELNPKKEK